MNVLGKWKRLSIRRKSIIWLSTLVAVMLAMMGIANMAQRYMMAQLSRLQDADGRCYAVQEALDRERQTLEDLILEESPTNRQLCAEACAATALAVEALPDSYALVGEDRYARTWSLRSGYEGYCEFREELLRMDPEDPARSGLYYRVAQMQEDLAVYALRLAQATLHQGAEVYQRTQTFYQATMPSLIILLMFVAGCAVTGLFGMLDRSLLEPIVKMSGQSRKIAENDFAVPDLSVPTDDEMGELILAFNRMKHATRDHITTLEEKNRMESELHHRELERLELEKSLDHTRLEMLKSQVNPHFLFNTLNLISCMARLEDAATTDRMILSLSGLFRYNLRTKEQEVYLEQELEALEDYIYIQQMRFDGRIVCKKDIRVDPLAVRLPAFTLQPVVENAFIHGLSHLEAGGRIFLKIWQEGNMLRLSIADNGRGMDEGQLAALWERMDSSEQTGRGIGLGNIRRRVAMLYPEGEMHIYSRPGRGTVIQFAIPQKERGD